jgi:hypothetical protein
MGMCLGADAISDPPALNISQNYEPECVKMIENLIQTFRVCRHHKRWSNLEGELDDLCFVNAGDPRPSL